MNVKSTPNAVIRARLHPSGFEKSDANFYSLSQASDGNLYYVLSSHDLNTHGRAFRYEPSADRVRLLGDLGELCGEAGGKTIPQGKSHCPFFECDGKLYFCTQYGFFQSSENKERPAAVPEAYKPYPGGHFLSYDMASERFEDLGACVPEDGIISMQLDPVRRRIYGLTWPRGYFLIYDISARRLRNLGKACRDGEVGEGERYLCLCRSLGLWPKTGDIYFTNADGEVLRYRFARDAVEPVAGVHMKRDIFGAWDPHKPGHQGYNWRDLFWHEADRVFYGIHPKSAYLFRFDPAAPRLTLLDRICAQELRENGRFEPFRYGYLSLRLGLDGKTIHYLTSTYRLTAEDGRQVKQSPDGSSGTLVHLVTYDLRTGEYADHGVLRLPDGRYPTMAHTLVVHPNGRLYSCPWIERPPAGADRKKSPICDLISFDGPQGAV
jgi:hypothetical protein